MQINDSLNNFKNNVSFTDSVLLKFDILNINKKLSLYENEIKNDETYLNELLLSNKNNFQKIAEASNELNAISKRMIEVSNDLIKNNIENNELINRVEKIITRCEHISKIIKYTIPINILDQKFVCRLLFDQHIIERMKIFDHAIRTNEKGDLLFLYSEKINLTYQDLLPESLEEAERQLQTLKKTHLQIPINYLDNGRKKLQMMNLQEVSLELFVNNLILENLRLLFEMNKGQNVKCIGRIIEDGELNYFEDNFSDDLYELDDFINRFFDNKGQLREHLPAIEFPLDYLTIDQLIERKVISQEGIINSQYQYLGNGFVEHKMCGWQKLEPIETLAKEKRSSSYNVDIIISYKGTQISPFNGHPYLRLETPEGQVYTVGLSTPELQFLSTHAALLPAPDERSFVPQEAFQTIKARYILPDNKAFTKLIKYLESLKSAEEKNSSETKCNIMYNKLTHNCTAFTWGVIDYIEKEVAGKRISIAEDQNTNYKADYIFKKQIESSIYKFCISALAHIINSSDYLSSKKWGSFDPKEIKQGITLGGYTNYGSIADDIANNRFKITFPQDLAIHLLNTRVLR